ncbi:porin [Utexia brackfieldae]|uniref:porin n=1 Tax=Utexia brackfieldae TaxID=3074108 RepID=UPI00370D2645
MKRNLLAIAIPALLVAGAANASIEVFNKDGNKLSINGRVKAINYISKSDNENKGDHTDARLGFTGETRISDSLIGYGRAEWQTKPGSVDKDIETRYAFAGLDFGDIGAIDYGKNAGILFAVADYTDVLPEFGGDAKNNKWYLLSDRAQAVATYHNQNFFGLVDGLNMNLQYADNSSDLDQSYTNAAGEVINDDRAQAYGANFEYSLLDTGLSLAGAYAQASGHHAPKSWATGLKYDANDLYVAATYFESQQKFASDDKLKARGFEVVAQYGIDFEIGRLTPSLAYIQHKDKSTGTNKDLAKYVDVGATYDFNKNLSAIIDYKINLLDEDAAQGITKGDTRDMVAVGLIYQF